MSNNKPEKYVIPNYMEKNTSKDKISNEKDSDGPTIKVEHISVGSEIYRDIKRLIKWVGILVISLITLLILYFGYNYSLNEAKSVADNQAFKIEQEKNQARVQQYEKERLDNMAILDASYSDINWRAYIPVDAYNGYKMWVFDSNGDFKLNIDSSKLSNVSKAKLLSESHKCSLTLSITKSDYSKQLMTRFYNSNSNVNSDFILTVKADSIKGNGFKIFEQFNHLYLDCGWFGYQMDY